MIFNRILWFNQLIKKRGLIQALKKLCRELYQQKEWVIFKLPADMDPIKMEKEKNIQILEMSVGNHNVFEQLSKYWPSEFPRYTKQALLQEFKSRLTEETQGYYLQEKEKPIGAMWLSSYEKYLEHSPFELKENDKIVKNIFISPSKSGRSLAKQLVSASIQNVRNNNSSTIYALVYPSRIASQKTFLALGFSDVGTLRSSTFLFRTRLSFKEKTNCQK